MSNDIYTEDLGQILQSARERDRRLNACIYYFYHEAFKFWYVSDDGISWDAVVA